jgi:hypothetical protein
MGTASICAWTLGHADKARERMAQLIDFGEATKNPFDLAFVRAWESWLYDLATATQALTLSELHGFSFHRDWAQIMIGSARAPLGGAVEGVALIRQGIAGITQSGQRMGLTVNLTRLAQAQALEGMLADALVTIEQTLQANPEERICRPETFRIRGELHLKLGHPEFAEADFREAIALSQSMSAKAWELRAATSLARLLRDTDRRDEARSMLVEIYNWFTEGFDTLDLKDAKALLDELSA